MVEGTNDGDSGTDTPPLNSSSDSVASLDGTAYVVLAAIDAPIRLFATTANV